jgi:serine/threonine protein kinase
VRSVIAEDFVFTLFYSHDLLSAYVFFWQNLVMQHVDHSAGDLIHLLQGLLRYDPMDRLTAREALRHPFFAKDHRRI